MDGGSSSYNMENMFDDIAARKSHDLLSILTSDEATVENDIHNLLDPWFQANYEGFCIRDFELITEIVHKLIALPSKNEFFGYFLDQFLALCRKPIMELKANERLSALGSCRTETFFSTLGSLFSICTPSERIKVGFCFRCISNGYRDPTVLRCDWKDWVSDPFRLKVTDKVLLQKYLRKSAALKVITEQFVYAAEHLKYETSMQGGAEKDEADTEEQASAEVKEQEVDYFTIVDPDALASNTESPHKDKEVDEGTISRELSQTMLDLCLALSEDQYNGTVMCSRKICNGAIMMIEKDSAFDARDTRISFTVELLWNVLESYKEGVGVEWDGHMFMDEDADGIMDFEKAVHVLKSILTYSLNNGFRLSDKELRNEIVVVLASIAQFPSTTACFIESGLLNMLVTYACVEEMGLHTWFFFNKPVAGVRNFATISDIDLEFKKELWFTIAELLKCNDPDALLCVGSSPLLECMLLYMEQNSVEPEKFTAGRSSADGNDSQMVDYSAATMPLSQYHSMAIEDEQGSNTEEKSQTSNHSNQTPPKKKAFLDTLPLYKLREFQLVAITSIAQIAPKILSEFERLHGQARILDLILRYSQSSLADHKSLVFHSLILMNKCLITSLTVRAFMEQNNAIETFLYIFISSEIDETRAQAVRLISAMCSNDNIDCQKLLKDLNGISNLIKPIEKYVENRKPEVGRKAGLNLEGMATGGGGGVAGVDDLLDPLENPYGGDISILIIAILDCISKGVVGCVENESEFADQEGVDALLNLLEISPFVLRIQILRVISDILRNQILVCYVNAWKSAKTFRSAGQLFCHCWLDEEVRMNAERKEAAKGVICDVWHPLGNHVWPEEPINHVESNTLELNRIQEGSWQHQVDRSIGDSQEEQSTTTFADGRSVTVTKLATAILAGRNATQTNLPTAICDMVLQKDTRVIIASALNAIGVFDMYNIRDQTNPLKPPKIPSKDDDESVSVNLMEALSGSHSFTEARGVPSPSNQSKFVTSSNTFVPGMEMPIIHSSGDLGLTPVDRQVLSMARKYQALRDGELWSKVQAQTLGNGIQPIEADLALLNKKLDKSFDAAQALQIEQMELLDEDHKLKKTSEAQFIGLIITKKDQQIKAEWLKKKRMQSGSKAL